MRVHAFLAFRKHLLEDCSFDPADLMFQPFTIDYRTSSNPIFWPAALLVNQFKCPLPSFRLVFADKCQKEFVPFCSQKDELTSIPSRQEFLQKLAQEILKYSPQFQENRDSGIRLFKGGNFSKHDRVKSVVKKLSNCEPLFLPDVENPHSWIPSEERQAELEKLKERNKPDLQELLFDPIFHKILKGETTVEQAQKYITEKAMLNNECGSAVRKGYQKVLSDLKRCASLYDEIRNQEELEQKTRRQVLGEFLYGFSLKGELIQDEIDEIVLHPQFEKMVDAVQTFLLLSLGTDFILLWQEYLLRYDTLTGDTKQPGVFIKGNPSFGKSFFLDLLFLPFETFSIKNSNNNTVDPKLLEQFKTEKTKMVVLRPHFLNLDEFNAKKFNGPDTLAIHDFNELFDTNKEFHTLKIKHFTLCLKGNAAIVLCTHHPVEFFEKNFDPSFGSRFGAIVDLNAPLLFTGKEGFPCREDGETDSQYFGRLKEGKFAADKPLFPLSCKTADTVKLDTSKINHVFFLNKSSIPEEDKIVSRLRKVKSRSEGLKENYLSASWLEFESISRIQASFVTYHAMVMLFDKVWLILSLEQKEDRFPLQSQRSLLPRNIAEYGLKYGHQHFKNDALKPSTILKYYIYIECPQKLVMQLIQDHPECLNEH